MFTTCPLLFFPIFPGGSYSLNDEELTLRVMVRRWMTCYLYSISEQFITENIDVILQLFKQSSVTNRAVLVHKPSRQTVGFQHF